MFSAYSLILSSGTSLGLFYKDVNNVNFIVRETDAMAVQVQGNNNSETCGNDSQGDRYVRRE
jgi:hypothetical protein